jgi:hypothetical protein
MKTCRLLFSVPCSMCYMHVDILLFVFFVSMIYWYSFIAFRFSNLSCYTGDIPLVVHVNKTNCISVLTDVLLSSDSANTERLGVTNH